MSPYEFLLPELGIDDQPITVCLWLVEQGSRVVQGEPIVEVLAGPAAVELAATADGVLSKILVDEGDLLSRGQPLALIRSEE